MTNPDHFSPEDPRLTAFALGELEGEELAAVEAALRDNPAARAAVEEIRATAAQLEAALGTEPMVPPVAAAVADPYVKKGKLLHFPQIYYLAGGLAAAVFAVLVAYREQPLKMREARFAEKKSYIAVNLPTVTAESAARNEADRTRVDEAAKVSASAVQDAKRDGVADQVASPNARKAPVLDQDKGLIAAAPAPAPANLLKEVPPASAQAGYVQSDAADANRQLQTDSLQGKAGKDEEFQKAKIAAPVLSGGAVAASGVSANGVAPASPRAEPEGVQTMSKFTVSSEADQSYLKGNSHAGGYGGMKVQRTPTAIEIKSAEFLAETNTQSITGFSPYEGTPGEKSKARADFNIPVAPSQTLRGFQANTESYAYQHDNDFIGAVENPLSTFSIDVDTASYANVRRFLAEGRLPPPDAVRVEELVNYFPYHYASPADKSNKDALSDPFAASMEVASAPWAPTHRLVRIGLKGREVSTAARGAANLVFLLDVSGSMDEPNKLPLVKESMRLLIGKLRPDDRVAIVVYAGASGLALPSTPVAKSHEILAALDALTPGGSTNGAMGIELAYDIAKANFVPGGLNRVILCTDGDFNVGVTGEGDLIRLIGEKAKSGVFLTVLGFGMGNIKDATLESLADKGNGNYGYIDTRREAEKLLVEQVSGTLVTIAKDVKLQVEFNPAQVASYRLIGYENRLLKKEDFNNDAVDAGEIGAGHTVTALYEIVPTSQAMGEGRGAMGGPAVDELKYQEVRGQKSGVSTDKDRASEIRNSKFENPKSRELLTLKVRYKDPAGAVSRKLEFPLTDAGGRFVDASGDFKFAAAVAEFGMILRDSPHKGSGTLAEVRAWAEAGTDGDAGGYRSEFIALVRQAEALLK